MRRPDLLSRGAVDAGVGDRCFSLDQETVLLGQVLVKVLVLRRCVGLGVAHSTLDLALVTGRVRTCRYDDRAVALRERLNLGIEL